MVSMSSKRLRTLTVKDSFISAFDVTSFQSVTFMGLDVVCFEALRLTRVIHERILWSEPSVENEAVRLTHVIHEMILWSEPSLENEE